MTPKLGWREFTDVVAVTEEWVQSTMIYIEGSKQSFRCECGCNVFGKSSTDKHRFKCNSCELIWRSE